MSQLAVPTLETKRLILRPLELADSDIIQQLFPQWEVVRWLAAVVRWPYPADGAERYLRDVVLPGTERGEEFYWSLRLRTDEDTLIGIISLGTLGEDNRGFWLDPQLHGRGLMTEAVDAVTAFWFETLGKPLMRVQKAAGNEASRRTSIAQGMRLVEEFEKDFVSGRLPAEMWELTAEEWRLHQKQGTRRTTGEYYI